MRSFKGYIINGYKFHVQDYDNGLRTQNYGVVATGETDEEDKIIDYRELTEILELQFIGGGEDWFCWDVCDLMYMTKKWELK